MSLPPPPSAEEIKLTVCGYFTTGEMKEEIEVVVERGRLYLGVINEVEVSRQLTSCAGTTCHACRKYLSENCNIFSVLSILKYNPGKTNNKVLFNILKIF